jgi:DNA-binding PadR family transcriptional regulator
MRLISRIEEVILLSIWRLQEDAYGITIQEEIKRITGKTWLTGAIYASLSRMLKNGLVESIKGEPTRERGGRHKIFYKLTEKGQNALLTISKINSLAWQNLPAFDVEESNEKI